MLEHLKQHILDKVLCVGEAAVPSAFRGEPTAGVRVNGAILYQGFPGVDAQSLERCLICGDVRFLSPRRFYS
jgi:hypothetical protein